MLEGIKREDPKLYETKVAQLRVEDELYGLLSSGDTPEEREKMRDQITRASRRLYELSLEERQQRIERLKEFIEREQNDLAVDRSQIDAMVNARVEVLIQEGQSGLRKDVSRRDRRRDRERTPSTHPGRQ